ncbi:MAG: type IV secretion system DNA-binding domain-containing protein [Gemmatimonadota bacterium]|nr:type IV secretion system DNA-binding domain-containing protein [Gemmatimonadota bacterium]
MIEVTREMFHDEMATAVFGNLRVLLLEKDNNHCQRVEFLPVEVMRSVCERVAQDSDLREHGVEAYVLAENAKTPLESESGALIEKRNRQHFGVLVAFIPQGLRLPAEDSYDIQTFKTYDVGSVLRAYAREMVEQLSEEKRVVIRSVLKQPSVKRLPVDQHVKYLLALKNDGAGWEEAGAYLFHLGLIPDLDLSDKSVETRIDRNSKCIGAITDENQSTFAALEQLAEKIQLEPEANDLRENLLAFLRTRNVADTDAWLHEILSNDDVRAKLNFAKWKFKDSPDEGTVEVHLDALRNPKTGIIATGFQDRDGNLVAGTDAKVPINLKWKVYPPNAPNLGHYVVTVVRDTDDEETGGELARKVVKNNKKSEGRAKVSLKEIELAEGETCAAKIILQARDRSGVILSSDESESFWIEGGEQIDTTRKKVNRVRNRAEAFFVSAYRSRIKMEVDSEGWEKGHKSLFRLKLNNRDVYHIALSPVLHETEIRNLWNPMSCGAWEADLRNRGTLDASDLKPISLSVSGLHAFNTFTGARKKLFNRFTETDGDAAVEVFDLRQFKGDILEYSAAYIGLMDEVHAKLKAATNDGQINNLLQGSHELSRIDTIHLRFGDVEGEDQVVLLAPTHPIRLLWALQYQQLLFFWAEKLEGVTEAQAAALISREAHEKITSLNIPSALGFRTGEIYVNTDNIDLYWGIMPRGDTKDVRKAVSTLLRLLGYKLNRGEITVITSEQVADRIWRYIKHHPYVTTLRINVINPGDGLLILNAIREIQKSDEHKHLNYDIAFFADLRYELMGSAFDEMTEGATIADGRLPDIDEELLRPNKNALFPKLTFSKRRVREAEWRNTELRESHITILVDRFSTKVLTRYSQPPSDSFSLHNLLSEYEADFDLQGDSATWSRKITPNQNSELLPDDTCAQSLFQTADRLLRLASCYYDWGNSLEKVPAIQLELSETDKHLINRIHENSDWVFTIDRNFGIEYFDNPRAGGGAVRSYLIDYTPEFLDGVGHRLIISTFWLSEIEGIIFDGLKKMGIPGTGFHASQILDILKSISGRLALKLINNPKDAREIIGLALTRLLLHQNGDLKSGVLIPVDSHIDLFAEHKRTSDDSSIRLQRSDLMLVSARDGQLVLRLIEVKYRSNVGGPSEDSSLKEAIEEKNANTRKVFEAKFVPRPESDRLDRELQTKELTNLLTFYLYRSQRHGLIENSTLGAQGLQKVINDLDAGHFEVVFEKAGYIFHTEGVSKTRESFKDNDIFIVGRNEILELLEIEDETREGSEPPVSPAQTPPDTQPSNSGTHGQPVYSSGPLTKPATVSGPTPIVGRSRPPISTGPVNSLLVSAPGGPKPVIQAERGQLRIPLGKNTDTSKVVYWDPFTATPKKLTNQHILIVGKSGAGKTQTASAFLWELSKAGVPFLIFDFQGEYISHNLKNGSGETFLKCTNTKVLDAADGISINPLEVPVDPHSGKRQTYIKVVYQVANSLAKIFALGDIQHAILRDAITQSFVAAGFTVNDRDSWNRPVPHFMSVWTVLKHMEAQIGGNVRNLNLRIQPLFETGIFLESADTHAFEAVVSEPHVLRLSNLATPELMVAVSRFVLQKVYADMLAKGPSDSMRVFAVVDEAHKLSYDETLTELIREARKYGVGILLASQSVKDFDRVVFDMVGTKISLQLEGDDAKVMSENLGLIDKLERDIARQMILNQAPHRALIRSNHFEPYIQADVLPFWEKRE